MTQLRYTHLSEPAAMVINDTYSVVLTKKPTANVVLRVQNQAVPTEKTAPTVRTVTNRASLTFTTTTWNIPQVVTITTINNGIAEGHNLKVFPPKPASLSDIL